jgi:hypothetical protein
MYDTGDVSDLNPTPFTPPGWAFSIWGVIYLELGAYAIYSATSVDKPSDKNTDILFSTCDGVGYWFIINMFMNSAWIIIWSFNTMASMVICWMIIVVMLSITFESYRRIQLVRLSVGLNFTERLIYAGWGVYAGWLLSATILNTTIVFVKSGVTISETYSLAMLGLGFGIYTMVAWIYQDFSVGIVCVWSYGSIALDKYDDSPNIGMACYFMAALMIVQILFIYGYYFVDNARNMAAKPTLAALNPYLAGLEGKSLIAANDQPIILVLNVSI